MVVGMRSCGALDDFDFLLRARVAHVDLEEKAVELGFGQAGRCPSCSIGF